MSPATSRRIVQTMLAAPPPPHPAELGEPVHVRLARAANRVRAEADALHVEGRYADAVRGFARAERILRNEDQT